MPFLESLSVAAGEVMSAFWHGVNVLAEQEGLQSAEAFEYLKREMRNQIKAAKPTSAIDYVADGRSARWRVRLSIWRGPREDDLFADTDAPAPLDQAGSTLIHGLPAVAAWVWDMIGQAHGGAEIMELSPAAIKHKIRTLRVALSNQGGSCAWRLRYSVAPPELGEGPASANPLKAMRNQSRDPEAFLALVAVSREEPAPRKMSGRNE